METVNDGAESALFKQLFQRWTVKDQTQGLGKVNTRGKVGMCVYNFSEIQPAQTKKNAPDENKNKQHFALAHIKQVKFDASLMHAMPEVSAQERMVDDGSGQVEVTDNFTLKWISRSSTI